MGDAVLVILKEKTKNDEHMSAHHVQTTLRQLNKRRQARKSGESYQKWRLKDGLSMGRVIMGNMDVQSVWSTP